MTLDQHWVLPVHECGRMRKPGRRKVLSSGVFSDNRFCKVCNDYLCPDCFHAGNFDSCDKCNGIECHFHDCVGKVLKECEDCGRKKCETCIEEGGENWDGTLCPTCAVTRDGETQHASSTSDNSVDEEDEEQD